MASLVERVDPRWITKGLARRAKSLGSHQQLTASNSAQLIASRKLAGK